MKSAIIIPAKHQVIDQAVQWVEALSPSYRLLGGKLVDSMFQRDTSWKDDPGSAASDQAASLNILREPYLITTKDGRKQTLAEYEKSLVQDYKRRSQLNLAS